MGKKHHKDKDKDKKKKDRDEEVKSPKVAKKTAKPVAAKKPPAAAKKAPAKSPATIKMPKPITIDCRGNDLDHLLSDEWLMANRAGAYSSSSIIWCNTRRYHGLLVAAVTPPVERSVALSSLMEWLDIGQETHELGCDEFRGDFAPKGYQYQENFVNDFAPRSEFKVGQRTLVKEIVLSENQNAVAVKYTLKGGDAKLRVRPFAAMRNFHHLRTLGDPNQFKWDAIGENGVKITDTLNATYPVFVSISSGTFQADPIWWSRFCYRQDIYRGQDGFEDIYCPGWLVCDLKAGQSVQITASMTKQIDVDFDEELAARTARLTKLAKAIGGTDETAMRLAMSTDAFIANRSGKNTSTIMAGFHWFADWGRDAFIALPGLLLSTWQFATARQVFNAFIKHISEGMVPNRFDDYSNDAHYNSIDASLWFIIAAERYVQASQDEEYWKQTLLPACDTILSHYRKGTRFGIHADGDGMLVGGNYNTQLTWMDAALGGMPITPRHGKPVEINALWYAAHKIMAQRGKSVDKAMAERYERQSQDIARSFAAAYWNANGGCLYDCITDGWPDAAVRPNQILAVSLPYSPIPADMQAGVVRVVQEQLLTPFGLRSLSPLDSRYRRRYGGSWESRDRAYHQGTVWGWLIGPFIEAYLKVHGKKPDAIEQARIWLEPFDGHINEAGLGYVSEIFDGDQPHEARGCIAQAWSVGEVLRAKLLVEEYAKNL